MLIVALLAVLRVPHFPLLEVNATANRVARAVWFTERLSRRVMPSVIAGVVSVIRPRTTRWEVSFGTPARKLVVLSAESAEADAHEWVFGLLLALCELLGCHFEVIPVEACR